MQTLKVNHFEHKKIDGIETWFWEDGIGNTCARTRKWTYIVQLNDSFVPVGNCAEGYLLFEIQYSGTPQKL